MQDMHHLGNSVYAEEDVALVQLLEPVAFSSFMLLYGVCHRQGVKSTEVQLQNTSRFQNREAVPPEQDHCIFSGRIHSLFAGD